MEFPLIRVQLRGDTSQASKHVPFAKVQAVRLERTRVLRKTPALSQRFVRGDGSKIFVQVSEASHVVDIWSPKPCQIWLDSGLVDVGKAFISAEMAPDAYNPSLLYLADDMAQTPRGLLSPSGKQLDRSTNGSAEPTPAYTIQKGQDREALPAKKFNTAQAPASVFSGKMRLFVQSLYGHRYSPDDVNTYTTGVGTYPFVQLKNPHNEFDLYGLSNDPDSGSCGIYIDANYTPWFVKIFVQSGNFMVNVRSASLTDCGQQVAAYLKTLNAVVTDNHRREVEAELMSQTWPSFTGANFNLDTGLSASLGAPLAYGWSFNWNGDTARCVLHSGPAPGSDGKYQVRATQVGINIFRDTKIDTNSFGPTANDQELPRWHVTSFTTGSGVWMSGLGVEVVWIPDYVGGGLISALYVSPSLPQITTQDAVIYGWYDHNDVYQTVHWKKSAQGSHTTGSTMFDSCWYDTGNGTVRVYSGLQDSGSQFVYTSQINVSVDSWPQLESSSYTENDWSIDGGSAGGFSAWTNGGNLAPVVWRNGGCTSPDDGDYLNLINSFNGIDARCQVVSQNNSRFRTAAANGTAQEKIFSKSKAYLMSLVIPSDDCSAIYTFLHQQTTGSGIIQPYGGAYTARIQNELSVWVYDPSISACVFDHTESSDDLSANNTTAGEKIFSGASQPVSFTPIIEDSVHFRGYYFPDGIALSTNWLHDNPQIVSPSGVNHPPVTFPNPFYTRTSANHFGMFTVSMDSKNSSKGRFGYGGPQDKPVEELVFIGAA